MSLINDALKRAQKSQPNPADRPSPGPRMQPVSARPPSLAPLLIVPLVLTLFLGLAVFLLVKGWQSIRNDTAPAPSLSSTASPNATPPVAARESLTPTDTTANTVSPPHAPSPSSTSSLQPEPARPEPDAASDVAGTPESPQTTAPSAVNSATPEPIAPPPKPTLRLQGIYYRPGRSSALLNGQTLYVGESDGSLKVLDIQRTRVTVEWNGQTKVLTLD